MADLNPTAIGLNRFGLAPLLPDPGSIDAARSLLMADAEQAGRGSPELAQLPSSKEGLQTMFARRAARIAKAAEKAGVKDQRKMDVAAEMADKAGEATSLEQELRQAIKAARAQQSGFGERLLLHWADHFTVSWYGNEQVRASVGPFLREVLRPRLLGRFEQMLFAATTHPAMLVYLNNDKSIGPGSKVGRRADRGLNENLAREVMELHSLGVDGGYDQQDVGALARILTGWTVDLNRKSATFGTTVFDAGRHEPGTKKLLGHSITEAGREELVEAIRILAAHPSTARNVARRLVMGFLSDKPPADAVQAVEQRFESSRGDLHAVTRELIAVDAMWKTPPLKVRPPIEILYIADRLLGSPPVPPTLTRALTAMGQPLLSAPSPKGWTLENDGWLSSDGIKSRLDWVSAVSAQFADRLDNVPWENAARSGQLGAATADAMRKAETKGQALALLLMSPELQRR